MFSVFILLVGVVVIFAITVFVGPPFVRSHKQPVESALDMYDFKKGDHLLDLGSGDGAVLLAAARRGVKVTGYEINPILWVVSRWRTRKFRELVDVKWGDMWNAQINEQTNNVYFFLDIRFLKRLDRMLVDTDVKLTVVSYSYKIPGKKVIKTKDGMYLYEYSD